MTNSRLEKHYNAVSRKELKDHFSFKNDMQIPKLKKI